MKLTKRKNARRGFTLLELTLVLLAMSVISAAIWIASSAVMANYQVNRVNQQLISSVQNIRDYYLNVTTLPAGAGGPPGDITSIIDGKNLFPNEMRRNPSAGAGATPIDHALNSNYPAAAVAPTWGSFHVYSSCPGSGAATACFRIAMQGLSASPCIKLLMAVPFTDPTFGIVQVGTHGMTPVYSGTLNNQGVFTVGGAAVSKSASLMASWCNSAGSTNEVDLDFRLHN